MKEEIKELGSLCKMAAELEREWDRAGEDYLGTRLTSVEYTKIVEKYLFSVRRLETALCHHLVAVTAEIARARTDKQKDEEQNPQNPG